MEVDCSVHETTAVTDSCQVISMEGSGAEMFLPRFVVPEAAVDDESGNTSDGYLAHLSAVAIVLMSIPVVFI